MAKKENEKNKNNLSEEKKYVPFDQENKITPLKLFLIVVNSGQANSIINFLYSINVSSAFVSNGEGTEIRENHDGFGVGGTRKQVIWTIVPEDKVDSIKKMLEERFKLSKAASGMALSIKITSMIGVSLYKFFVGTDLVKGDVNGRR